MFAKGIRITTLLTSLFAVLLVFLLTFCIREMIAAVSQHNQAEKVLIQANAVRDVFDALQNTRFERGPVISVLKANTPASSNMLENIGKLREASGTATASVIVACGEIDCGPGISAEKLTAALDRMKALRPEIDTDLRAPLLDRRASLAEEWRKTATVMVDMLETISNYLGTDMRLANPVSAELIAIKDAAYLTRDAFGLERIIIGEIVDAGTMTEKQRNQMLGWRGQTHAGWAQLKMLVSRDGMAPRVEAAFAKTQSAYIDTLLPIRDKIDAAMDAGAAAPIAKAEWDRISMATLDDMNGVSRTALDVLSDYAAEQNAEAQIKLVLIVAVILLALATGVAGLAIVRVRVIRAMAGITKAMLRVSEGDLDTEIPYRDRKDEIGELAGALAVFQDNAEARRRMEAATAEEQRKREERQQAVEKMVTTFDDSISGVLSAVAAAATELERTSTSMTDIAQIASEQAHSSSMAAQQTSVNVQTVAAAADEMSSSTAEIARQVEESTKVAQLASREAEQTGAIVENLANSAKRIGEVVGLINEIAEQTNLLALNATIEAARAGEAGKGFAVVASEVKNLASQTAKATEEIVGQIDAMQLATGSTVEAISSIAAVIVQVNEISATISTAVEEQNATTAEIARNVQEAASATEGVTDSIEKVSGAAEQTGAAGAQVLGAAQELSEKSERMRREVETFLADIRAA